MTEKMTETQLLQFAEDQLPAIGVSEDYRAWYERVRAVHPEATRYYANLKRLGKVRPSVVYNEDGTVTHTIQRIEA